MTNLKKLLHDFRNWQRTPYTPAPLSLTQYVCVNCGESFEGDYCPRCGQKGDTKRLTMKNVLTSALDVWGAGNHSMPRNIIHLIFRPGYMIADYLKGHRQPYFPPFKMLFVFVAVFLVFVGSVRWSLGQQAKTKQNETVQIADAIEKGIELSEEKENKEAEAAIKDADTNDDISIKTDKKDFRVSESHIFKGFKTALVWFSENRAIAMLAWQVIVALGVWVVFRRSPRMGKLSYSEQFFAQVFITSQIILFSFFYYLFSLMWVRGGNDDFPLYLTYLAYYFDYKQLFGYGWWSTFWRSALVLLMIPVIILMLIIVLVFLLGIEDGIRSAL